MARPSADHALQSALMNQAYGQQSVDEFNWLLSVARPGNRFLEIGSCFGWSIKMLGFSSVKGKPENTLLRAVDIGTIFDGTVNSGAVLYREFAAMRDLGFNAEVLIGSSHGAVASMWARQCAPYDLVLIDGDHSYEGVRSDWETFGPMGRMVAFHDIGNADLGVKQLWDEIKVSGVKTDERICPSGKDVMGIGIVFQEA